MRFLRGVLSRRFFGFVPGWIALVLVLGGTAAAVPPVYNGIVMMDASATVPASSGYVGPVVVSQATAQPTPQPGNPYVNNYIMGDGINGGLWELCNNCSAGIGAGGYAFGHYHVLWVTNPGDTTAPADVALGGNALGSGDSSTGQNVALGVGTLENKTSPGTAITGNSNVAVGNIALGYLTSGSGNNGIGAGAGKCISTGSSNEIMGSGWSFLAGGCTGSGNVMIGNTAGQQAAASLSNSVLLGNGAGQVMAQGGYPVAIGYQAGLNASGTNGDGVFIGDGAGKGASGADESRSVAIGGSSGGAMTTGANNTLVGFQSGLADTGGSANTFLGLAAGSANTTGSNNTAIGYLACGNVTTGTWNICIGYNAYVPSATNNGQLSIANAIYGVGNNTSTTGVSTGCILFYSNSTTCPSSAGVYFNASILETATQNRGQASCSLSASTSCTATVTVLSGASCTATLDHNSVATAAAYYPVEVNVSGTVLSIYVLTSSAQTGAVYIDYNCV